MPTYSAFLSYSRQQLYFTESLAAELGVQNIPVWFDLQRLKPGVDWEESIKAGIEASRSLVAIVSKASIASPYVRQEWALARQRNLPVIAVIYEAVDSLPVELSGAAVLDMRTDFKRGVQRLAGVLRASPSSQSSDVLHDRLPPANRFGLSLRAPRPVWLITALLLFTALLFVPLATLSVIASLSNSVSAANLSSNLPGYAAYLILADIWLLISTWRWMQHRADFDSITYIPMLAGGLMALAGFILTVRQALLGSDFSSSTRYNAQNGSVFGIIMLFVGLIFLGGCWRLRRNFPADGIRWQPAGQIPQEQRKQLISDTGAISSAFSARVNVTYAMHYDDADSRVADEVHQVLTSYGHKPTASREELNENTIHIAVLSTKTPQEAVEALVRKYDKRLVVVIASSLDLKPPLDTLSKYQWVDFRTRDQDRLRSLAEALGAPQEEGQVYSALTVPERVTEVRTAARVATFGFMLRGLALSSILSFGTLLTDTNGFGAGGAIIGLVVAIAALFLVDRLFRRALTIRWMLIGFVAFAILGAIGNATIIDGITFSASSRLSSQYFSSQRTKSQSNEYYAAYNKLSQIRYAGEYGATLGLLPLFVVAGVCYRPLRRWLPVPAKLESHRLTAHISKRIWTTTGLYMIGGMVLAALTVMIQQSVFGGGSGGNSRTGGIMGAFADNLIRVLLALIPTGVILVVLRLGATQLTRYVPLPTQTILTSLLKSFSVLRILRDAALVLTATLALNIFILSIFYRNLNLVDVGMVLVLLAIAWFAIPHGNRWVHLIAVVLSSTTALVIVRLSMRRVYGTVLYSSEVIHDLGLMAIAGVLSYLLQYAKNIWLNRAAPTTSNEPTEAL